MSDATTESLSNAYQLIETENLAEARSVLEPLLTSQSNNPDVWWLYAHAVEDTSTAQNALNKLHALDPNYPGAQELRSKLQTQLQGSTGQPVSKIQSLSSSTNISSVDDIDFDDFDDFDINAETADDDLENLDIGDEEGDEPNSKRRTLFMRLTFLVILLLVALIIFGIISGQGEDNDTNATPTAESQVAGQPTATIVIPTVTLGAEATQEVTTEPTEDVVVPFETFEIEETSEATPEISVESTEDVISTEVTEEVASPEPEVTTLVEVTPEITQEDESTVNDILSAFSSFQLAEPQLETIQTDMGSTTIVAICAEQGISRRQVLNDALFAYAAASSNLSELPDAIGVRLADCTQGSTINIVAVPFSDAVAFLTGSLNEGLFIAEWRAVARQ